MPIRPPSFNGVFLDFTKGVNQTIIVKLGFSQGNGTNYINNRDDVAITVDLDSDIDPYPTTITFLYDDGETINPITVTTGLDKVSFNGQITESEDDLDSKLLWLFSDNQIQDFTNGGSINSFIIFPKVNTTGLIFKNAPNDTYKALMTAESFAYTADRVVRVPDKSGTLALTSDITSEIDPFFTASPAYGITGTNILNWNQAFSWGNHANAGYLTSSYTGFDTRYSLANHTHTFDSLITKPTTLLGYGITDAQQQLNGVGFVKANGTTITYDNSTYLTSAGTISNARYVYNDGTYGGVAGYVNASTGLYSYYANVSVTSSYTSYLWTISHYGQYYLSASWDGAMWYMTSNLNAPVRVGYSDQSGAVAWNNVSGKPTTIGGYGITDFNFLGDARWSLTTHNHNGIYYLVTNPSNFISANQNITLSGDIIGSGTTSIVTTLPNIVIANTLNNIQFNSKGQVIGGSNASYITGTYTGFDSRYYPLSSNPLSYLTGINSSQVISALTYTPENISNKATSFGVLNNILYPTVQAVVNYVAAQNFLTSSGTISNARYVYNDGTYGGVIGYINASTGLYSYYSNISNTSNYSTYLWSTSHNGQYYISNAWDGTYWRFTSNHSASIRVGYADLAASSNYIEWTNVGNKPNIPTDFYSTGQIQNFFSGTTTITGYNKTNWDTSYSWGNHANAGYLTQGGNINSASYARYVYDNGAYSGAAAYREASAMYVYSASIAGTANVANSIAWTNVFGRPTNLSQFYNDSVFISGSYTGFDSRYYLQSQVQNFFSGATAITGYNKSNWDTSYGWGNHASIGYITALSTTLLTNKSGSISQWTNDSGYITSGSLPTVNNGTLTLNVSGNGLSGSQSFSANQSGNVTFTVSSNATTAAAANTIVLRDGSGYINNSYFNSVDDSSSSGITYLMAKFGDNYLRSASASTVQGFLGLGSMAYASTASYYLASNPSGFINAINYSMVTTALGYIPYNSSNPVGYITSSSLSSYYSSSISDSRYLQLTGGILTGNLGINIIYGGWPLGVALAIGDSDTGFNSDGDGDLSYISQNVRQYHLNNVIHTTNYNSYSPTLNGSGASGTWAINVSGAANSATYGRYVYDNGAYSGEVTYREASAMYVAYSNLAGSITGQQNSATINADASGTSINSIIRRTNDGYSVQSYIYYTPGANENPTIGQFIVTNNSDNSYMRKASIGTVQNALGLGSNAYSSTVYAADSNAVHKSGNEIIDGGKYFRYNKGSGSYLVNNNFYGVQAFSDDTGAAAMSFHRGGQYAINFGLDPDNVMRIGGWSNPYNIWSLDMSGNNMIRGAMYATSFYEPSDIRLKKIVTRKTSDLFDVIDFTFKDKSDNIIHTGYVAQDVEKVLPNQVQTNSEGIKSVNYIEVHTIKIYKLEERIKFLENELDKFIK